MKFLIDANLPFKLSKSLMIKGFDVIHTDDLPHKERTTDQEIRVVSVEQDGIVITKDSDFLDSRIIQGIPSKLLLITTGNITNKELLDLFEKHFESSIQLFALHDLIELNNQQLTGHER
jgi:predicted nuclease of predicted toxin-antitoxin system